MVLIVYIIDIDYNCQDSSVFIGGQYTEYTLFKNL